MQIYQAEARLHRVDLMTWTRRHVGNIIMDLCGSELSLTNSTLTHGICRSRRLVLLFWAGSKVEKLRNQLSVDTTADMKATLKGVLDNLNEGTIKGMCSDRLLRDQRAW